MKDYVKGWASICERVDLFAWHTASLIMRNSLCYMVQQSWKWHAHISEIGMHSDSLISSKKVFAGRIADKYEVSPKNQDLLEGHLHWDIVFSTSHLMRCCNVSYKRNPHWIRVCTPLSIRSLKNKIALGLHSPGKTDYICEAPFTLCNEST